MEQIPIRDEKLIFYNNIEHDELMYILRNMWIIAIYMHIVYL